MISPKYALSHYYFKGLTNPHVVNLYLDYNCPFSAKMYFTLFKTIPQVQKKHPDVFQFVFVNVVQPWHPQSVLLNEYALVVAQLLREKAPEKSNELFWNVSYELFANKDKFFDSVTSNVGRNDYYKLINDVVFDKLELPITKTDVLGKLEIAATDLANASNAGNAAIADVKYFTRYLRGVGVHITPTVSVNGIVADLLSSASTTEELIKVFESFQ
ncbi:hypothetical protein PUMCH_001548 [Australozyma saopauloensis]|uniref:Thioredoxin-like fold domain-containing protein n=1 Tax=Australozyma saopauloensis TaxID=291208 RepID=A0AAX4H6T4_9ASCO|nr:hypothetical protein PUMCH_001548 [[Candida] saopauloensis]